MLKLIEGLPADIMAIEAVGEVTHEDYRNTLFPKAEAMMAKCPIKMLYVVGNEFTGFDLEALWDDSEFGIKYWHDFSQIAVVTDYVWMRTMVSIFIPFIHAQVRLFKLRELSEAKDWIARVRKRP